MVSAHNTKSPIPVHPIMHNATNSISYVFPYHYSNRHDALKALELIRKQLPPLPTGMQDYSSVDPVHDKCDNVIGFRPYVVRKPDMHLSFV